jgi:hypothetical protein
MSVFGSVDTSKLVGFEIDGLDYQQRLALAGKYVALELYSPQTKPVRKIEAVSDSPSGRIRDLKARGLDPAQFEIESVAAAG